jgi:hypothetical protein
MGRGTILGGGAEGLYSLRLDFGKAVRDARVAAADAKIEKLNVEIAQVSDAIVLAEAQTAELADFLRQVIEQMIEAQVADDPALLAQLQKRSEEVIALYAQAAAREAGLRVPRDLKIAERKELVASKGRLLAALIEETQQVWCVDFTEDASGEVATIEIPGEDRTILIAPGGRAPAPSDGALVAREIMSPEQAFFNAAILPGWQKFKPTYRKGTITFLDEDDDTASVDLDPTTSSANRLNVNQSERLLGIPVEYMECNAQAFQVGDRVVVGFDGMEWESPKVIGFVDNPQPCLWLVVPFDGTLVANNLILKCNLPGLVSQLRAGSPEITILYSGVGTFDDGVGPHVLSRYAPGGVEVPGVWSHDITRPALEQPNPDVAALETSVSITPPELAGPALLEKYPHGFLTLFTSPPRIYVDNPGATDTGEKNICEIVIRIGGEKVLHAAFTDPGFLGYIGKGEQQIKGVPFRNEPPLYPIMSRLTGYDFALP